MARSPLEKLKSDCADQTEPDASLLAKEGEGVWLIGLPAKAEDGMIGLSMNEHQKVMVRERDILEVVKDDKYYLVKAKRHADVVIQYRTVTKIGSSSECECPTQPDSGDGSVDSLQTSSRSSSTIFGGTDGGEPFPCPLICRTKEVCVEYWDDKGFHRRVCVLYLDCEPGCIVS